MGAVARNLGEAGAQLAFQLILAGALDRFPLQAGSEDAEAVAGGGLISIEHEIEKRDDLVDVRGRGGIIGPEHRDETGDDGHEQDRRTVACHCSHLRALGSDRIRSGGQG